MSEQIGRLKRSHLLFKAALATLRTDKELVIVPLVSFLMGVAVLIPYVSLYLTNIKLIDSADSIAITTSLPYWVQVLLFISFVFLTSFISTIAEATVLKAALERLRGNDPALSGTFKQLRPKIVVLAMFSLLDTTVGLILRLIEERVPLGGRIATWLVGAAWAVANVFSIAVIIDEKKAIRPLQATRKSANLIQKVWGESMIANVGIALVGMLYIVGVLSITTALAVFAASAITQWAGIVIVGIGLSLFFVVIAVLVVLSGIVKAAIYHYAITGESPVSFEKRLLKDAMTPRKARKVFGA